MNARTEWKKVQHILGTAEDGIPGQNDQAALERLQSHARLNTDAWTPTPVMPPFQWNVGKASSFADPADVRAFRRCKAEGKSDQECFKVGDNGIGKWGTDTTQPIPMVALPPEDWKLLPGTPRGTLVIVEANGRSTTAQLEDTMPRKENIKNGAIIDLNEACCKALGLTPPVMAQARWRWA